MYYLELGLFGNWTSLDYLDWAIWCLEYLVSGLLDTCITLYLDVFIQHLDYSVSSLYLNYLDYLDYLNYLEYYLVGAWDIWYLGYLVLEVRWYLKYMTLLLHGPLLVFNIYSHQEYRKEINQTTCTCTTVIFVPALITLHATGLDTGYLIL